MLLRQILFVYLPLLLLVSCTGFVADYSHSKFETITSAQIKIGFLGDSVLRIAVPSNVERIIYCRPLNLEGCKSGLGEFFTTKSYAEMNGKKFFESRFQFDPIAEHSVSIIAVDKEGNIMGERRAQFFK